MQTHYEVAAPVVILQRQHGADDPAKAAWEPPPRRYTTPCTKFSCHCAGSGRPSGAAAQHAPAVQLSETWDAVLLPKDGHAVPEPQGSVTALCIRDQQPQA